MMGCAERPLIAGNWKMHGLAAQLQEIESIAASVHARPPAADVLICVPATLLSRAAQAAAGRIALGGEDCHAEDSGPFTGDVSAGMLNDAGATAVIVGHSERPMHHGETDPMVAGVKVHRQQARAADQRAARLVQPKHLAGIVRGDRPDWGLPGACALVFLLQQRDVLEHPAIERRVVNARRRARPSSSRVGGS